MSNGLSKREFEHVFSEGKRVRGSHFSVGAAPGTGKTGIATSKKIGCIARRNRQKRRVKAALKDLKERFSPELDYVVIVGPAVSNVGLMEIEAELDHLLRSVNERWAGE